MRVDRLREGLWLWTGLHPSAGREVTCVYFEGPGEVVLVDPLVPPEAADEFLRALDRDVERLGRPVAVVLTSERHRRSADDLAERYGGRVRGELPEGVVALPSRGEVALWIAEHRALVVGHEVPGHAPAADVVVVTHGSAEAVSSPE